MQFDVRLDQLDKFATDFWQNAKHSKVFAFHGDMGAGKTTMINTLCHHKGTKDATGSPTFSIINEYSYTENGEAKKIFHIDLYRLKNEEEIMQAGVEDCVYSGSVCMVEWAEKAPHLFDDQAVHVYIEPVSETERKVVMDLPK
ncbi:MAG: tRNA (adenosine(37)-N6)-threonylcarbamoyltransferase complex ATPase subunit type 1 TsaE [Flavisolibacter sp.]